MDDQFLSQFQEDPPEEFGKVLYAKLTEQEHLMETTLKHTNKRYLSFVAIITLVVCFGLLMIAIEKFDSDDVQISPIKPYARSTTQNSLTYSPLYTFGTGAIHHIEWSSEYVVAGGVSQVFLYDQEMNLVTRLPQEIDDSQSFVVDVGFSSDNTWLVINMATQIMIYQKGEEWSLVNTIEANPNQKFLSIAVAGSWFAYGDNTNNIVLKDLTSFDTLFSTTTYSESEVMVPFPRGIRDIAINSTGTKLATVNAEGNVKLWQIDKDWSLTLVAERTPEYPTYNSSIVFDLATDVLALAWQNEVHVLDSSTLTDLNRLTIGNEYGCCFDISIDAKQRIFLGLISPNNLQLWDYQADRLVSLTMAAADENAIPTGPFALSPNASKLAAIQNDNEIMLWDVFEVTESSMLAELRGSDKPVTGAFTNFALSSNNILAAIRTNGSLELYNAETGELLRSLTIQSVPSILRFSPDNNFLVISASDFDQFQGILYFVDVDAALAGSDAPFLGRGGGYSFGQGELMYGAAFSTDGTWLITGGDQLRIWDLQGNDPIVTQIELSEAMQSNAVLNSELSNRIMALAISPNETTIAGLAGNIINVWDTATGDLLFSHYLRDSTPLFFEYTSDGQYLMTLNTIEDPAIRFWDVYTGKEVAALRYERQIYSATLTPDKLSILTFTENGIWLWDFSDLDNLTAPMLLPAHHLTEFHVSYTSLNSNLLAFLRTDGIIEVWSLQ